MAICHRWRAGLSHRATTIKQLNNGAATWKGLMLHACFFQWSKSCCCEPYCDVTRFIVANSFRCIHAAHTPYTKLRLLFLSLLWSFPPEERYNMNVRGTQSDLSHNRLGGVDFSLQMMKSSHKCSEWITLSIHPFVSVSSIYNSVFHQCRAISQDVPLKKSCYL